MKCGIKKILAVIITIVLIISGISCFSVFAENTEGFPPGDINRDGNVDITDAVFLQKIITKIIEEPQGFDEYSDMNCDSEIDIKDVTVIQKFLAEIYPELPINKDKPTTVPETGDMTTSTTEELPPEATTWETSTPTSPVDYSSNTEESTTVTYDPGYTTTNTVTTTTVPETTVTTTTVPKTTIDINSTDPDGWHNVIIKP